MAFRQSTILAWQIALKGCYEMKFRTDELGVGPEFVTALVKLDLIKKEQKRYYSWKYKGIGPSLELAIVALKTARDGFAHPLPHPAISLSSADAKIFTVTEKTVVESVVTESKTITALRKEVEKRKQEIEILERAISVMAEIDSWAPKTQKQGLV